MKKQNLYKEEKFDSFLNKTIMMSSRKFFIKQMNINSRENTIFDNADYTTFLQKFADANCPFTDFDNVELNIELNKALNCLSEIEHSVIFLLFNEELTQSEAAEMLEIYSKTVSKIKLRAIHKLKKYLKGDFKNEK